MDVSIVTPSYNMFGYLRRCGASVADQEDATHEHVIVDGGSTDGTVEWLSTNPGVISVVEPDRGMYDALNKGLRRATGDIVSHLNCDEQYLPGTLSFVKMYFDRHPSVDVLFGDALLVRPDGTLIAFRKGFKPIQTLLKVTSTYLLTCTMFIRRRVIEGGHFYDDSYKDAGDAEFIQRLMGHGYTLRHVRRYLSVFTMTGANRTANVDYSHEARRIRAIAPWWAKRFRPAVKVARWGIKALSGTYIQSGPIVYSIYATDDADRRTTFMVEKASPRWRTA